MTPDELCLLPAVDQADLLRRREVSVTELVAAHLERVAAVNPRLHAIVTLTPDDALAAAAEADAALARGHPVGPLHGLPVAHKDLQDTRGVRTTYGSTVFADHVPDADSAVVERVRAAGAISLGKTNTPEFGTGSQTYNAVFGTTLNPYDLRKTPGGSSGGAAAALAAGLVALADGSDMGGSLRNPASFCNVVGLRPCAGRIPTWPNEFGWFDMSVAGPMGRTVADTALLLGALAGFDPRCPHSLPGDGAEFLADLTVPGRPVRVAWSRDLGGLPVDPRVTAVLEKTGRPALHSLGWQVDDRDPDLTGAEQSFRTLRAWYYAARYGHLLDEHSEVLNPDVVANISWGRQVTGADLADAERARTVLWQRVTALFADYDVLACPVSPVPPFDAGEPWVAEIDGVAQQDYLGWMRTAYWISATGLPAVSVPCGFTDDGLPVGLQLVGRPCDELGLLRVAYAFEQATAAWRAHPPEP